MWDFRKNKNKIFTTAIETVKSYDHVNYPTVDINCRLKVVFKDGSGNSFYRHHEIKRNLGKGRHQSSLVFWCLCITVVLRFEHWAFVFVMLCVVLFASVSEYFTLF